MSTPRFVPWSSRALLRALVFGLLVVLAGCAAATAQRAPAAAYDPLESMNRKIFWFNDKFDGYVLKPVATGWDKVVPTPVERSIGNFFSNLRFPVDAGNDLLQVKFKKTGVAIGRFVVNTTIGVAGFFDPASGWGLERSNEDLGQTFGFYGIPPGPYLVLPILGPSDPRDAVGLIGDSFMTVYPWFVPFVYTASSYVVNTVNSRALVLTEVNQAQEASLDFYSAVRDAYFQRRRLLINDGVEMSPKEQNELYFLDESGDSGTVEPGLGGGAAPLGAPLGPSGTGQNKGDSR